MAYTPTHQRGRVRDSLRATGQAYRDGDAAYRRDFLAEWNAGVTQGHITLDDVGIRPLFEAFCGANPQDLTNEEIMDAINQSNFPDLTSGLVERLLIDTMTAIPTIGDQLVQTFPSDKETELIRGFKEHSNVEEIAEGNPYPETATEQDALGSVTAKKRGQIIAITFEMIRFNKIGGLIDRITNVADAMVLDKELRILNVVFDTSGTGLAGSAVYAAGNNNLLTPSADADVTTSDAETLYEAAREKQVAQTSWDNRPVVITSPLIVCRERLAAPFMRVARSETLPEGSAQVENVRRGAFTVVTSPVLEQVLTSAQQDFLYGQPSRDFGYHQIEALMTERIPGDPYRDIAWGMKAMEFGQAFCRNFRHTVKTDFSTS